MNERHEPFQVVDRRTKEADSSALTGTEVLDSVPIVEINVIAEVDRIYSDPTPTRDSVLIRQNAAETTWAGTRFVIPDSARQNPNKGVVVAVGPELAPKESADGTEITGPVKPGDMVTFGRFNAEPIDIDGEEFQLVRFHDVKLVESVTYALPH